MILTWIHIWSFKWYVFADPLAFPLGFHLKLLLFCNELVKNSIRASPVCQFSFMFVISVMKKNLILSFLKCFHYFAFLYYLWRELVFTFRWFQVNLNCCICKWVIYGIMLVSNGVNKICHCSKLHNNLKFPNSDATIMCTSLAFFPEW